METDPFGLRIDLRADPLEFLMSPFSEVRLGGFLRASSPLGPHRVLISTALQSTFRDFLVLDRPFTVDGLRPQPLSSPPESDG